MDEAKRIQWLDAETKACLQKSPPVILAPPSTETFSVVVLNWNDSTDSRRRLRAIERVLLTSRMDAAYQASKSRPFVLKQELSLSDALLAQFELICCEIVSVFVADTVISHAESRYLNDLYDCLIRSDEFATVGIVVTAIPRIESAIQFVEQFIGDSIPLTPHTMLTTRKKARIMTHWAGKAGVTIDYAG